MKKILFFCSLLFTFNSSVYAKPMAQAKAVNQCIDKWSEIYRSEDGYQDALITADMIDEWESLCKRIPQSGKICERMNKDRGQCKIDYFLDL